MSGGRRTSDLWRTNGLPGRVPRDTKPDAAAELSAQHLRDVRPGPVKVVALRIREIYERLARGRGFYLVLAPSVVLVLVVFVYPTVGMLIRSFTEPPGGLAHYQEFLGAPALLRILA